MMSPYLTNTKGNWRGYEKSSIKKSMFDIGKQTDMMCLPHGNDITMKQDGFTLCWTFDWQIANGLPAISRLPISPTGHGYAATVGPVCQRKAYRIWNAGWINYAPDQPANAG